MFDVVVVGAGLSGLSLAQNLTQANPRLKLLVVEKSKSSGGRMATRRVDDARFDHGAQFIKTSAEAERMLALWRAKEALKPFPSEEFTAFCGASGMTGLAKVISEPLSVQYNCKVTKLVPAQSGVRLEVETGEALHARRVVLSCPLPQSVELLSRSNISFDRGLAEIHYVKAIVGLARFSLPLELPSVYVEQFHTDIFAITSQKAKGLSNHHDYTLVMSAGWSEVRFEESEDLLSQTLVSVFARLFPAAPLQSLQVKKWRYGQPLSTWKRGFETAGEGIYLIGDAFGGPSLNGALRSAEALFEHLKTRITLD